MKRSLQQSVVPAVTGVAVTAAIARLTMRRHEANDAALRQALRSTGNLAFATFAFPLALAQRLPPGSPRVLWRVFIGAHAVHATLIVRLARRHESSGPFSPISAVGGAIGYTTIVALTAASIAPGRPPRVRWRRRLQRSGHNILLGMHAFTIVHGYLAKGRNATAYGPLAALWLAAARNMDRTWRT
jgi:hypothetical protein